MGIETNLRRKIQFKLLDVIDQPEGKMSAYTRKLRAFQEFLFHSSDRSGDKYTDRLAFPGLTFALQIECKAYTATKYIFTRANLFQMAES